MSDTYKVQRVTSEHYAEPGTLSAEEVPKAMCTLKHHQRAILNHQQTLERLDERGGLSALEWLCILDDVPIRWVTKMTLGEVRAELAYRIAAWKSEHPEES